MDISKLSFEQAILKLEEVVKDLEDENISLDSAMEKFETGVKLSEYCLKKLNEAEKKIEELTRSVNGKLEVSEIDLKEDEGSLKN
ncbi:MAG: exodeoxyribonuclease VII small subunit [Actinobacteria bacterium]|nr:exodeoxyribonuclease VII small subunit [Cyanobacteriota bacterium]MCL6087633.1 exodeoxyribonuclease VII small subunit [Actinomycetota bacterium]